jgi:hypothetical protein
MQATGGRAAVTLDAGPLAPDAGVAGGLESLVSRELAAQAGQSPPKRVLLAAPWSYDSGPGSNVVHA